MVTATIGSANLDAIATTAATIGVLVIGHAPRAEVTRELEAAIGPGCRIKQRGALDRVPRGGLHALAPQSSADTLFTRLPDGTGITLSKQAVTVHGDAVLTQLAEDDGCDAIVVMCTGAFPTWERRHKALFPSRLLEAAVRGVQPQGRLGVLVPTRAQVDELAARWQQAGYEANAKALSPNASAAEAAAVGDMFAADPPDLLVYDCISYLRATKQAVERAAGVRGLLAIGVCARFAAELAG